MMWALFRIEWAKLWKRPRFLLFVLVVFCVNLFSFLYVEYQDVNIPLSSIRQVEQTLEQLSNAQRYEFVCAYAERISAFMVIERLDQLPQTELLRDKDMEILYLTDNVDEFALRVMMNYDEKEFRNISSDDLGLETDEEKKEAEKQVEENKDLLTFLKDSLNGKVKEVILSQRLKSHPVCLSTEGAISLEMEKVLNSMPNADANEVKASRVLEINANHPVFATLTKLYDTDKDKLKTYAELLYNQALLIEGLSVEDPVAFSNQICSLML